MGQPRIVRVTPTVTAGAYSANDVVGATLTFSGIPDKGFIVSLTVVDQAKQAGAYQLVLFDSLPTNIADNGAYDIADADLPKIVGAIHLTDTAGADKFDFSDNKIYMRQALVIPYRLAGGSTSLYGFLIALGSPTFAATTDVQVQLGIDG